MSSPGAVRIEKDGIPGSFAQIKPIVFQLLGVKQKIRKLQILHVTEIVHPSGPNPEDVPGVDLIALLFRHMQPRSAANIDQFVKLMTVRPLLIRPVAAQIEPRRGRLPAENKIIPQNKSLHQTILLAAVLRRNISLCRNVRLFCKNIKVLSERIYYY